MAYSKKIFMQRAIAGGAAAILWSALGAVSLAQNTSTTRFGNGYLNGPPKMAQQLAGNPALMDNQQFMASHQGLREDFTNHSEIRTNLKERPHRFMSREEQLNNRPGRYFPPGWNSNGYNPNPGWNASGSNPGLAVHFDNGYLRSHRDVAQQLIGVILIGAGAYSRR